MSTNSPRSILKTPKSAALVTALSSAGLAAVASTRIVTEFSVPGPRTPNAPMQAERRTEVFEPALIATIGCGVAALVAAIVLVLVLRRPPQSRWWLAVLAVAMVLAIATFVYGWAAPNKDY